MLLRDSLRGGFARGSLDLLLGIGNQASQLARQLKRRVGSAGGRGKRAQIIDGMRMRRIRLIARCGLMGDVGGMLIWRNFHVGPWMLDFLKCEPVFGREGDAPYVAGIFEFEGDLKQLADGAWALDPGDAAADGTGREAGFRMRNFQLDPHIF